MSVFEVGTTTPVRSARTDALGWYGPFRVPAGTYDVRVTAGGFAPQVLEAQPLEVSPVTIDWVLLASSPRVPTIVFSNYVNGDGVDYLEQVCSSDGLGGIACSEFNKRDSTQGLAVGDLDGDGDIDVVLAGDMNRSRACLRSGIGGAYVCSDMTAAQGTAFDVALGDLDGDGDLDSVFAMYSGLNRVCLNDGLGAFPTCSSIATSEGSSFNVAVADIDVDGNLDAVFANERIPHRVCLGDGLGGFSCSGLSASGDNFSDVKLGDVDNDGNADAVFTGGAEGYVCLGDGLGGFACSVDVSGGLQHAKGVDLGDLNNDGNLDAVTASSQGVCLGDGAGSFTCSNVPVGAIDLWDVGLGDIDSDGILDAVFAATDGPNPVCFGDGLGSFPSCSYVGGISDYDSTGVVVFYAVMADPTLYANPLDDLVVLEAWPTGSDIAVEVFESTAADAPVVFATTLDASGASDAGDYETDLGGIDLLAGHHIVATNGDVTETHTVTGLSITSFDFAGDSFTGLADVGNTVIARASNASGEGEVGPLPGGEWTADFTPDVSFMPIGQISGYVAEFDADQNATYFTFDAVYEELTVDEGETSVTTDDGSITVENLTEDDALVITTGPPSVSNGGFEFLGDTVDIESDATGTPAEPLILTLRIPAEDNPTGVDPEDILVFKDDIEVADCISPLDPGAESACVEERILDPDTGEIKIAIRTLSFSVWTLAFPSVTIDQFGATEEPVELGTNVTATGTLLDVGKGQTTGLTATISWDDNDSCEVVAIEDGAVSASYVYAAAGVFTPTLRLYPGSVTDCASAAALDPIDEARYSYVVVYDTEGGFVTGGGWIHSEAGSYPSDTSLEGKATFGFVSKYKKGASIPTGNTEFQFRAGELNFHSSSYDWLVVTGSGYARYKGTGTINGAGEYEFMIWAGDGDPDTFRIKIWSDSGDGTGAVIYDNGMNQALGSGSIVVHVKK